MVSKSIAALALGFALVSGGASVAQAQGASPVPSEMQTPTTKVVAIGHMTPKWSPAAGAAVMPQEVRATVELYLEGKIDQWYFREDQPGVVFVVNARSVTEARAVLEPLPLGRAGLMDFDYVPVGPLAPLRALIGAPPP